MDVVVVCVFFVVALCVLLKRWSVPAQELIDDYYSIAGVKIWMQEGTIQFGRQKMSVSQITRLCIEASGNSQRIPAIVVYFADSGISEWEIARFPASQIDKANSVLSNICVAIEKAGGPQVVCQDRFSQHSHH